MELQELEELQELTEPKRLKELPTSSLRSYEFLSFFGETRQSPVTDTGVLCEKTKALIALAVGVTTRGEGGLALHLPAALQAGATWQEALETISITMLMEGGPERLYGLEMMVRREALDGESVPHPD